MRIENRFQANKLLSFVTVRCMLHAIDELTESVTSVTEIRSVNLFGDRGR